jgi:hypothetical protein
MVKTSKPPPLTLVGSGTTGVQPPREGRVSSPQDKIVALREAMLAAVKVH